MVKKVFKPIIFDIFRKKEQIATARTNSHGQAQIATACGGPLVPVDSGFGIIFPDFRLTVGRPYSNLFGVMKSAA
jgi:hypothetical protein